MLMIAISIVSHRMSNSFAEPRQPSLLSLTCKFEHLLHHSFLTETQGTCFSVAKLLNINKSAKQNNKFIFTLPVQTVANRCCKIADRYWLSESLLYTEKRFGGDDAVASPPPLFLAHAKTQSSKPIICP